MKNLFRHINHRNAWTLSLVVFPALLLGLVPRFYAQAVPQNPTPATVPGRGQMGMMNDQNFIVMMIPHHEGAIAMADLALTRAQHPEIKQLAENIKISQNQEIKEMQAWYKQWYGTTVPKFNGQGMGGMMSGSHGNMGGMMGNMTTDLTALKNASNFDQVFIEEMIPHHQMAVMMSQHLLFNSQRPEMQKLAQNIIQSQTKEIQEMQQWYQQWYGTGAKPR